MKLGSISILDLGKDDERYNTLYTTIEASHDFYVVVGKKRYLLSDLIEAYNSVHQVTEENEKQ